MRTRQQVRKRKLMTETEKDPDWLSGEKQMKMKNDRSRRRIMQDRSCKNNKLSFNLETPSQSSSRPSGIQVTCGDKGGILHKEKFNNSEPCIFLQDSGQWLTPPQFEKFGGKGNSKKWKNSILYYDHPLQTLIKGGFLSSPSFKRKKVQDEESSPVDRVSLKQTKCKRALFPSSGNSRCATNQHTEEINSLSESSSDNSSDDDDGDDEVDADMTQFQGPSAMPGQNIRNEENLEVTCGAKRGKLHKEKFNNSEPCIFLQDSGQWLTPPQFEKFGGKGNSKKWKNSILYYDHPLQTLIKGGFLSSPSFKRKKVQDEEDKKNDDVCFFCNFGGLLVCCDNCPRAFHHRCHSLPLKDDELGDTWICSICTAAST